MSVGGDERTEWDAARSDAEVGELVAGLTEEEKLGCLDGDAPFWAGIAYLGEGGYHKSPFRAARIDRIGFPGFAFSDGPRGVVVGQATCFPVSMARGATFDPDLEERIGEAIGLELRSIGADLFGGICVNVLRHPAWGRAQETYGEDPCLVGEMGAALCRGVQRHAMACVKHLACNSMENARFQVDVTVDEIPFHEVFLPHFRRVVDEGAAVVMSAYNSVNGSWCGENRELLTEVLRDEWGFEGFVISDWIFGIRDAAKSLRTGLDVEMPYQMVRASHLRQALSDGAASWSDVDGAVTRVVTTRQRFDAVLARPTPGREVLACPEHRALARQAAARSLVLLRNEPVDGAPVLPLDLSPGARVALLGALATEVDLGDGGSSDVWAPSVVTPEDGLREAMPGVILEVGGGDPEEAAALAQRADVAIVVVGYTRCDEGEYIGASAMEAFAPLFPGEDDPALLERFTEEISTERLLAPPAHVAARPDEQPFDVGGDRLSLRLHSEDVALIRSVAAVNPRTVVLLVAGSAVVISEWDREVPAVVQSWYSGMEGGRGIADVLSGRVDASGRLPFSVPVDEGDLPPFDADATAFRYDGWHGYWYLARRETAPAYPFGFGLSYTTFLLQAAGAVDDGDAIAVRATLRNDGSRRGSDVVQVYAHRRGSDRPARLCGFSGVEIDAGGSVEVDVRVDKRWVAERDPERHAMVVRADTYELRVARHACDPGITLEVEMGDSPDSMSVTNADGWDPDQYNRFAIEREQPFFDLAALLEPEGSPEVADLGCGDGRLTAELHRSLGAESTLGVDRSPAMIERAGAHAGAGVRFELGDIGTFERPQAFDVVFANASLQWVPDHRSVLRRWAGSLRPRGQLAIQVPANADHPAHLVAAEVAAELLTDPPPDAVAENVLAPEEYAAILDDLGCTRQLVRLQVYVHRLDSTAGVVEWVKGTTLTRFKAPMGEEGWTRFVAAYRARLLAHLGERSPYAYFFKRIIFWGRLP